MAVASYDDYRAAFESRHENRVTSALATAGDALWLAAVPTGVLSRSAKTGAGVFVLGTAVAVVAHLFQPGTVKDEIVAVLRHPVWAARAETRRVWASARS